MMEKIYKYLSNLIPQDKLKHFFWGAVIAWPLVMFMHVISAWFILVFIAVGKELWDVDRGVTKFNIWDAVFTAIPAIMFILIKVTQH
tara:strand:+ start:3488 stop:3748 length:261 start_codon:yes stop_codon:yes gene_type:complete